MDPMFFTNSILLGAGLAMDAVSVSIANALAEPHMTRRRGCAIAGTFALFQFLMPLIGWVCVHTLVERFTAFQRFVPWIALLLLLYIGGSMLWEGIRGGDGEEVSGVGFGALMVQGVATSIDALSVGFTIADHDAPMAFVCALLIATVTFVLCALALRIGRTAGQRLGSRATIAGGIILIAIGIEIFFT